jgi:glutamate 5-kinase
MSSPVSVIKIGTSSITAPSGELDETALVKLADDLAAARGAGRRVVLVMSGAIAAGMPALGLTRRPTDMGTLQAIAAVGQPRLLERMSALLGKHDVVAGQVLLTPYDFLHRSQYLHARVTLQTLLDLGVLPIVNENDTVADDEIRYGDNDRLAALVAHMLAADVLVMLTDTAGLFTADPRRSAEASLIQEVLEVDGALEQFAGGTGSERGSGGMASKLAAAKIAAWSGVRAVIASAALPGVVTDALAGHSVGTSFAPRAQRLASRKLWIAFARAAEGKITVDAGARRALVEGGKSLLPAGVREVEGDFEADATVEIVDDAGAVFAKGLCRYTSQQLAGSRGRRTAELPEGLPHEVVHRDDLVVLP